MRDLITVRLVLALFDIPPACHAMITMANAFPFLCSVFKLLPSIEHKLHRKLHECYLDTTVAANGPRVVDHRCYAKELFPYR